MANPSRETILRSKKNILEDWEVDTAKQSALKRVILEVIDVGDFQV
jgi:hypothetical protein